MEHIINHLMFETEYMGYVTKHLLSESIRNKKVIKNITMASACLIVCVALNRFEISKLEKRIIELEKHKKGE